MADSTPGPWGFTTSERNVRTLRLKTGFWEVGTGDAGKGGKGVAFVFGSEANARLVAAAPELLEACEVALRDQASPLMTDGIKLRAILRAAIARAKGGPP